MAVQARGGQARAEALAKGERASVLEKEAGEVEDAHLAEALWEASEMLREGERHLQGQQFEVEAGGAVVCVKQGPHTDGIGAKLWDCSKGLVECLSLEREALLKGAFALELGCGVGFLSLAIAQLGVEGVTATDGDETALSYTRENIAMNEHRLHASIEAAIRRWGEGRRTTKYHLILGSELIYAPEHCSALAEEIEQSLGRNGVALLAQAVREESLMKRFEQELKERGLTLERKKLCEEAEKGYEGGLALLKIEW